MAEPGRPTVMTPEVIRKIEEVAALDGTVKEMAYYAGIHFDTLYAYLRDNPEFSERIQALREKPVLLARQTIIRAIAKDANHAFRYVEKKRPHEFATTTKVEHSGAIESSTPADQAALAATDALRERFETELRATIVKAPKPSVTGKPAANPVAVGVGTPAIGEKVTKESGHLSV